MVNTLQEASMFLMRSTLGASYETISSVATKGISTWLDEQLNEAHDASDTYQNRVTKIWQDFRAQAITASGDDGSGNKIGTGNATLPYNFYWRMGWWHRTLAKANTKVSVQANITTTKERDDKDLVRHRVAQALSEIVVISDKSNLELDAIGMASFYDIFYEHAFGNYTDILKKVSLHPCMGVFLTHLNNKKESGAEHPDENYAREIMQLFTIGLTQLNANGTEKKDANGKAIPTYDNNDIKKLAKVFTGVKANQYQYEWPAQIAGFNNNTQIDLTDANPKMHKTIPYVDMVNPMKEESTLHDDTAKQLLAKDGGGYYIDIGSGQTLVQDINKAVDDLVKHPNCAPFISKKLIQQLVTSNPSDSYVADVAAVFGNTGDLKAVVKKILTHADATATTAKKLKSPLLRVTQLLRAFKTHNTSGKLWFRGDIVDTKLNQHVLSSPTVFNFYLPNYSPHGKILDDNQVAPEFQLHNSATSIAYVNMLYDLLFSDPNSKLNVTVPTKIHTSEYFRTSDTTLGDDKLGFDFTAEKALANASDIDDLIKRVSLVLTGKEDSGIKAEIKDTIDNKVGYTNADWVVQTVVFMVAISAEYTVLKQR
jgi:uncharacterized protein (DUF1800 family)